MRRRFGRFFRQGNSEGPQVPPALRQANQLMTVGNYPAAAVAFEDLAKRAESRSGPPQDGQCVGNVSFSLGSCWVALSEIANVLLWMS
jgi:hypothetical protein